MTHNTKYHNQPPGLLSMYGKALLPKRKQKATTSDTSALPDVSAQLIGAATGGADLNRYRKVCGFERHRAVPSTCPMCWRFPCI